MTSVTNNAVPGKGYRDHPGYEVRLEPVVGRLRVMFAGEAIVDTTQALILHETRHDPVYYFQAPDINPDALSATDHSTHCPFKGDASYWSLTVDGQTAENAVWGYPDPLPEVPELSGLRAIYWDRADSWWLDDVQINAPVTPGD